jgi:hypothetical protein
LLFLISASCLTASLAHPAHAASTGVTVPGLADIWLAGQPNGTILNGGFPGDDVAPTNSPVLASTGLDMTAGSYLTVAVTGATDYNGCASTTPDGGGGCGNLLYPAALGVSGYNGPINALVGVFLDASVPSGAAPPALDFSTPASLTQATVSPQLRQVFFIGDGRTGTGTGSVQRFVIPAGATRLYLASSDGIGANYNNFGSFSVVVTDATPAAAAPQPIPVSSPLALLLTTLLVAVAGGYLFERRAAARRS